VGSSSSDANASAPAGADSKRRLQGELDALAQEEEAALSALDHKYERLRAESADAIPYRADPTPPGVRLPGSRLPPSASTISTEARNGTPSGRTSKSHARLAAAGHQSPEASLHKLAKAREDLRSRGGGAAAPPPPRIACAPFNGSASPSASRAGSCSPVPRAAETRLRAPSAEARSRASSGVQTRARANTQERFAAIMTWCREVTQGCAARAPSAHAPPPAARARR
jgi:hypothetical protein